MKIYLLFGGLTFMYMIVPLSIENFHVSELKQIECLKENSFQVSI